MAQAPNIDGVLIQWGDRLFYAGNHVVKVRPDSKLNGSGIQDRANAIRARIAAAIAPHIPQVMVDNVRSGQPYTTARDRRPWRLSCRQPRELQ